MIGVFEFFKQSLQLSPDMPPHPAKVLCRSLVTHKIDVQTFIDKEFGKFWVLLVDYLERYHNPYSSRLLKIQKCINVDVVIDAFKIIIQHTTPAHYPPDILPNINKAFEFLLHADTPEDIRTPASQSFMNIIEKVDSDHLHLLSRAFDHIVPYPRLSRDDQERKNFTSHVSPPGMAIVILGRQKGTSQGAYEAFSRLLKWLANVFDQKEEAYTSLLLDHVLSIVYRPLLGKANTGLGFKEPIVNNLHRGVLDFFKDCLELKSDFRVLLSKPETAGFIFKILEVTKQALFFENVITTLFVLRILLGKGIEDEHVIFAGQIAAEICPTLLGEKEEEPRLFFSEWFRVVFERFHPEKAAVVIESLFQENQDEVGYFLATCLVHFTMDGRDEILQLVRVLAAKFKFASAAACRYAQMLATVGFPIDFALNIDNLVELCNIYYARKGKGIGNIESDKVVARMVEAVNDPGEFTRNVLEVEWPEFESIGKGIGLPYLQGCDDEAVVRIHAPRLLEEFDYYTKEREMSARRNVYAVNLAYVSALVRLTFLPQSARPDFGDFFVKYFGRILRGICEETDSIIVGKTMETAARLMSRRDLLVVLDDEGLDKWYFALCLATLSSDDGISGIGFREIVRTIIKGTKGSGELLPLALSIAQTDGIDWGCEETSLLFTAALLDVDQIFVDKWRPIIEAKVKQTPLAFHSKILSILKTPTSGLGTKAIEIMRGRKDKLSFFFGLLLKEITGNGKGMIPEIMNIIGDSIESSEPSAVLLTRSLIGSVAQELMKSSPKPLITLCERITKKAMMLTNADDESWSLPLLELASLIYLTTFSLTSKLPCYNDFCTLLRNLAEPDTLNSRMASTAKNLIEVLSIFGNTWPFPHSSLLPTSPPSDLKGSLFATSLNGIVLVSPHDGASIMRCQTPVGQFEWRFEPAGKEFYEEKHIEDFSIPISEGSAEISPSYLAEEQKSVFSLLSGISDGFSIEPFEFDPLPETNLDNKSEGHLKLRPPVDLPRVSASVMSAIGHMQVGRQKTLRSFDKETGSDEMLKSLSGEDYRFNIGASIIYNDQPASGDAQLLERNMSSTSPMFREFLYGLGWAIESEPDAFTIQYSDAFDKVTFHVPEGMQNISLARRKAIIGEDNILVVWNECQYEFEGVTVISDQHIFRLVITPLPTGLFSVESEWRPEFNWFGRLLPDAVISKELLPLYVRTSVISAQNAIWNSTLPSTIRPNYVNNGVLINEKITRAIAESVTSKPAYHSLQKLMST